MRSSSGTRKGRSSSATNSQPREASDQQAGDAAKARIREVVPFRAATTRIVITRNGKALATVPVSKNAPKVTLLSPNGGEELSEKVTLRWRASDADKNRLWYTVLYSPDGKQTIPIATRLSATSLAVDLTLLPGGQGARFEVIASDGVRTGSDRSNGTFRCPSRRRGSRSRHPQKATELVEGQTYAFVGAQATSRTAS